MIVKPIINPDTKKPYTNAEMVCKVKEVLDAMKTGSDEDQIAYAKITNGDEDISKWCDYIASIEDPTLQQKAIENTLLPVSSAKPLKI